MSTSFYNVGRLSALYGNGLSVIYQLPVLFFPELLIQLHIDRNYTVWHEAFCIQLFEVPCYKVHWHYSTINDSNVFLNLYAINMNTILYMFWPTDRYKSRSTWYAFWINSSKTWNTFNPSLFLHDVSLSHSFNCAI